MRDGADHHALVSWRKAPGRFPQRRVPPSTGQRGARTRNGQQCRGWRRRAESELKEDDEPEDVEDADEERMVVNCGTAART